MVKILQQIRASLMQNLAKFCACSTAGCARFRHRTRQQLDAEILQHQNVFAPTPAEVLVRCASTAQRICNEFAHFLAEKLRNRGAERTVFSARNTAPTCIGAALTSCEFHIGIFAEENAKFGAPRADIAKNLQQFYRGRWVELQKVISSEGSFLKKVH